VELKRWWRSSPASQWGDRIPPSFLSNGWWWPTWSLKHQFHTDTWCGW
jgi:hypothetical protein